MKTAAGYLSGLRDFAAAYMKPELIGLVCKSRSIIEEIMWDKVKEAKQTKLTDFIKK